MIHIQSSTLTGYLIPTQYKQSFSGDYKHIDGDGPLKSMIIPKYSDMTKDYFATGGKSSSYFGEIAQSKHSMRPQIMTESFLPMPHTIKNPVTLLLIH